ncbi:MAG: oligosaccharide flippase family protein [Candidatus Magasanikbacteria bacterium]
MSTSVAKNTALMTTASVLQKVISFVYFTIVARSIGAEGTGKYFFALSFTAIFTVFVDLGLTNVLVRESARVKEKIQEYFSSILFVKVTLGFVTYIGAIVVVYALGYPTVTRQLVYISGITMVLDSIHLSIYGVLRAIGNLKYESIGIVMSQFLTLVLGSIFLYFKLPLIYLMIAFVVPSLVNVLYAGIVLYVRYHVIMKLKYNREVTRFLFTLSIPFALAAIFSRVYGYIDSVLLSKLATDQVVGWYSIPYKIAYAFQFIPVALIAALYPRFSEYFVHSREKLQTIFQYGLKYLLLISMPIAVGIAVLASKIVPAVFTSEYLPSIVPLQILMAGVIFGFINFEFGALLNACNRQKLQTVLIAIVMVINIIMNSILIPRYGASGAAMSAAFGNIVLSIISMYFVWRIVRLSRAFIIKMLAQLVISTVVMGAAVWYTSLYMNFIVAIIVGGSVYACMLFITRGVTIKQMQEVIAMFRKN